MPRDRLLNEVVQDLDRDARGAFDYAAAVQRLLRVARTQLGMEVAWTSEFAGGHQVYRYVDAAEGALAPPAGTVGPVSGSFCAMVIDGRLPALIPDARADPSAALIEASPLVQIASYVGAPLIAPDGTVVGMLCATSSSATPSLDERDLQSLRLIADVLRDLQTRALSDKDVREQKQQLEDDVERCLSEEHRQVVVQPVVSAVTGLLVAAEGLSRFSLAEHTPAWWFHAAAQVGRRRELELAAARSVLKTLPSLPDDVALMVNLSPTTVLHEDVSALLAGVEPTRIVLELTEHESIGDYAALRDRLEPHRRRGLRIAVDDAGAGYASLRHVLDLSPDIVKLDMALVRGVDADPARRALVEALARFCAGAGRLVVAEGVETAAEGEALRESGIDWIQGFHVGRPLPVAQMLAQRQASPAWRS